MDFGQTSYKNAGLQNMKRAPLLEGIWEFKGVLWTSKMESCVQRSPDLTDHGNPTHPLFDGSSLGTDVLPA